MDWIYEDHYPLYPLHILELVHFQKLLSLQEEQIDY